MDKKDKNFQDKYPIIHRVNVFHIRTLFSFLHITCPHCKLQSQCKKLKNKYESCVIAEKVKANFGEYVYAQNSAFHADEFYLDPLKERRKIDPQIKEFVRNYKITQYER